MYMYISSSGERVRLWGGRKGVLGQNMSSSLRFPTADICISHTAMRG